MSEEIPVFVLEDPPRRSRLRRLGCGILLVLWFMILLLPCVLLFMATQGELVLQHASVPEPDSHPFLQISLITEADYRGFQIVNTVISQPADNQLCVQTNVSYILWEGSGDPVSYCDCYMRDVLENPWTFFETLQGACP